MINSIMLNIRRSQAPSLQVRGFVTPILKNNLLTICNRRVNRPILTQRDNIMIMWTHMDYKIRCNYNQWIMDVEMPQRLLRMLIVQLINWELIMKLITHRPRYLPSSRIHISDRELILQWICIQICQLAHYCQRLGSLTHKCCIRPNEKIKIYQSSFNRAKRVLIVRNWIELAIHLYRI